MGVSLEWFIIDEVQFFWWVVVVLRLPFNVTFRVSKAKKWGKEWMGIVARLASGSERTNPQCIPYSQFNKHLPTIKKSHLFFSNYSIFLYKSPSFPKIVSHRSLH